MGCHQSARKCNRVQNHAMKYAKKWKIMQCSTEKKNKKCEGILIITNIGDYYQKVVVWMGPIVIYWVLHIFCLPLVLTFYAFQQHYHFLCQRMAPSKLDQLYYSSIQLLKLLPTVKHFPGTISRLPISSIHVVLLLSFGDIFPSCCYIVVYCYIDCQQVAIILQKKPDYTQLYPIIIVFVL